MKKPTPGHYWRRRSTPTAGLVAGQAIRALLRLRLGQPVALVLDVDRDLGQRLGVHAAVVRAEQQFSAIGEEHANIRLGAAAIADVQGRQRPCRGYSSSQRRLLGLTRF
jgi:hypothetical protein